MSGYSNETNRKIRKPLMERKRRARINHSLDELYHLLTETEFASKGAKLEKADILEMTVRYVKHLRAVDYEREAKENLDNLMRERYQLGFERCAEEVDSVLDLPLRETVHRHLRSCLEKVKMEEGKVLGKGWRSSGGCSVVIEEPKDLEIVPSKLPNGDVLLLLSSKGGGGVRKMWRPWW